MNKNFKKHITFRAYSRNLGQHLILARKDTFFMKKSTFLKKKKLQKAGAFDSRTQHRSRTTINSQFFPDIPQLTMQGN